MKAINFKEANHHRLDRPELEGIITPFFTDREFCVLKWFYLTQSY